MNKKKSDNVILVGLEQNLYGRRWDFTLFLKHVLSLHFLQNTVIGAAESTNFSWLDDI